MSDVDYYAYDNSRPGVTSDVRELTAYVQKRLDVSKRQRLRERLKLEQLKLPQQQQQLNSVHTPKELDPVLIRRTQILHGSGNNSHSLSPRTKSVQFDQGGPAAWTPNVSQNKVR